MSESTFVVVNPASANGKTGKRWIEMAARLRGRIGDFESAMTEAPRQATALVRDALCNGATHIVSVGGDGTHNEVVNGFFDGGRAINGEAMLSLIPTGTGGDLRRTLDLPMAAVDAIEHVGERPVAVDIGVLSCDDGNGNPVTNHFVNISSFGLAGQVVDTVNRTTKVFGGKFSFILGSVRATAKWRNQRVRMVLDPDTPDEQVLERRIYLTAVANARFFGGGMMIAPGAVMDDGLFDVVVMGDISKAKVLLNSGTIYKGTHLDLDEVEHHLARAVRAEAFEGDPPVLIDMDGEQPGVLPATWTLLPKAMRLCVGPNFKAGGR